MKHRHCFFNNENISRKRRRTDIKDNAPVSPLQLRNLNGGITNQKKPAKPTINRQTCSRDLAIIPILVSPRTEKRVRNKIETEKKLNVYFEDKVDFENGYTLTPRKRPVDVDRMMMLKQKVIDGIVVKKRFYFIGAIGETFDGINQEFDNKTKEMKTVRKPFGPYTITVNDLWPKGKFTKERKKLPSQNKVCGGPAKEVATLWLNSLPKDVQKAIKAVFPGTNHWLHILAACIFSKTIDTQDQGNLTAGSPGCNLSMLHYEKGIMKLLREMSQVVSMTMQGCAHEFTGSRVARSIDIKISYTTKSGRTVTMSRSFSAQAKQTEIVQFSKIFNIITRDGLTESFEKENSVPETSEVPEAPKAKIFESEAPCLVSRNINIFR